MIPPQPPASFNVGSEKKHAALTSPAKFLTKRPVITVASGSIDERTLQAIQADRRDHKRLEILAQDWAPAERLWAVETDRMVKPCSSRALPTSTTMSNGGPPRIEISLSPTSSAIILLIGKERNLRHTVEASVEKPLKP